MPTPNSPSINSTNYFLLSPFKYLPKIILLLILPTSLILILLFLISFTTQLNIGEMFVSVAFSPLRMVRNIKETDKNIRGLDRPLRVMTFNIWLSGARVKDGMEKIAKHIAKVDPDIVALQEVKTLETAGKLIELLNSTTTTKWQYRHHPLALYPDTAILTKHEFIEDDQYLHLQFYKNITNYLFQDEEENNKNYTNISTTFNSITTYGMGATIWLKDEDPKKEHLINFVCLHLDYRSYGPYAANNKKVNETSQIMAGERNKEGNELKILNKYMKNAQIQPLIVAGDFNSPSHLDWIEETKSIHGGWIFEWPATKLIMDAGLNDSFRAIFPDPVKDPGITWSTVQKKSGPDWDWTIPEPQDRIDFIFYKPNENFWPINSQIYAGKEELKPLPDQYENDWPSDHFSVIMEIEEKENKNIKENDKEEIEEKEEKYWYEKSEEGENNSESSYFIKKKIKYFPNLQLYMAHQLFPKV
ncbi:Endo/exonuclease/phosphatase domain-containing protein [Meloidogyne graminicola]|uniref:Endo/exonuclease/phosphatase domain-containing protein n=1 Tax=Meloidogyne graminicola TaxID=189291 RepID=A0A8T0A1Y3_9BILA|nr:Endo/exonuclease/phosphatase domain-containing protein [Meloidogyne graminicola]